MLRASKDSWVRASRTTRCLATLTALAAAGLATAQPASADAPWRAFSPSSPWNEPAAPESVAPTNPYASQFARSPGFTMKISGTPENPRFASPIYFAQPGDPAAPVTLGSSGWSPRGSLRWNGQSIPVPAGVAPAAGSDGHLVVVSADRRTAWEFWRCTAAGLTGYTTEVLSQWDLTGPGYAPEGKSNSARGSGTPLISTTLRADEALNGINHALGITVPSVSGSYVFPPATHSDGDAGPGALEYGMLFVLRPDYQAPPGASIGVRNVVRALKAYGAYVVDQGADFEIDADFTHPELWAQTGLEYSPFDFTGADFRPAKAGPPGPPPPEEANASRKKKGDIALRVSPRRLAPGRRLHVSGKVRGAIGRGARVRIMLRTSRQGWRCLQRKPVRANGTFAATALLSRTRRVPHLALRKLRLDRRARVIGLRAVVPRVGESTVTKLRIRPRG